MNYDGQKQLMFIVNSKAAPDVHTEGLDNQGQ